MPTDLDPLISDLVEWVGREPRLYSDVMDAWRTSCPRLTVWEDAVERGYVERKMIGGVGLSVIVTDAGLAFLAAQRRLTMAGCVVAVGARAGR